MARRFAYFYFMKNEPDRIRSIVPSHIDFWRESGLQGYMGGPFADRSGGLITFEAEDLEAATEVAMKDPFTSKDVLESKWIKEWIVE